MVLCLRIQPGRRKGDQGLELLLRTAFPPEMSRAPLYANSLVAYSRNGSFLIPTFVRIDRF